MNGKGSVWFTSKEDLFAVKGGECDYVHLEDPMTVKGMMGGKPFEMTVDFPMPSEEKEGFTHFFTCGIYVPDEECENGIFLEYDTYQRLCDELDEENGDEGEVDE